MTPTNKAQLTNEQRVARDQRQMKYLFLGIGLFVTGFASVRLLLHYIFGYTISGYSRKFGNYDESLYWVFFVIGSVWLIYASISYYRFRQRVKS